jgi:hypothetical protein
MPFLAALNPIHWLLLAFALISTVLGGLYYFQGKEFELEKARHAAFVAETKAVGLVQERKGKEQKEKDDQRKKEADHEITLARNSIAAYADRLRLAAKNTRSGLLSSSTGSPGSSEGACFDRAQLIAALGEYSEEMGSIRREATELVIEGAKGVADLDGAKEWAHGE